MISPWWIAGAEFVLIVVFLVGWDWFAFPKN